MEEGGNRKCGRRERGKKDVDLRLFDTKTLGLDAGILSTL